jgi:hypothetical protein
MAWDRGSAQGLDGAAADTVMMIRGGGVWRYTQLRYNPL